MFMFQDTAPWRRDCHAGLKSRQRAPEGRAMAAQHPAPGVCLLGRGAAPVIYLIQSSVTASRIQTHLDTGDCTDPRLWREARDVPPPQQQLTPRKSLSGSSDMSRLSRMGHGVKGLWLKSILHREIFSKCLATLWNHTGSVLLSAGVVQTHLCFMRKTRKRKIQLCRASLLYKVSFPGCFPSFPPACRQV